MDLFTWPKPARAVHVVDTERIARLDARTDITRIIRLKGASRLYLTSPYPFADMAPYVPFVSWNGKQKHATRFRTAKAAYSALAELKGYEHGRNAEVARLRRSVVAGEACDG
jgi:hypothetical protein